MAEVLEDVAHVPGPQLGKTDVVGPIQRHGSVFAALEVACRPGEEFAPTVGKRKEGRGVGAVRLSLAGNWERWIPTGSGLTRCKTSPPAAFHYPPYLHYKPTRVGNNCSLRLTVPEEALVRLTRWRDIGWKFRGQ